MKRRIKGSADMVLYWLCTAVLVALMSLLGVYLSGCGGEKAPPKLADYVSADVLARIAIKQDTTGAICKLAKRQLPTVRAITICSSVYFCRLDDLDDDEKLCLLVHEAKHVEQNGKDIASCIGSIAKYGVSYGIKRFALLHTAKDAYRRNADEIEAREAQQKCIDSL